MSPENHVVRSLTRALAGIGDPAVHALAGGLIFDMQMLQRNRRDPCAVALVKRLTAPRLVEFEAACRAGNVVIVFAPSPRKRRAPVPSSPITETAINIAAQTLVGTVTGN